MLDDTLEDKQGIELDAEMAQRLLEEGDGYSRHIAGLATFIAKNKDEFRKRLEDLGLVQRADPHAEGFDLAAVDGASTVKPRGGGAQIVAAAYKVTINDEKQRGDARTISIPNDVDAETMATLLRIHLELSLLTPDKLDVDRLVVLDHSFWGILQQVSRALAAYKRRRMSVIERGHDIARDALLIAWRKLFLSCLGRDGSFLRMIRNKQIISLAKTGLSQYYINLLLPSLSGSSNGAGADLEIATTLNDRALLRHILKPGEYTIPMPLYESVQESSSVKSWRRGRFATPFDLARDGPDPFEARHQVLDEYGIPTDAGQEMAGKRLFVTYYRPYGWSRVYRMEFHELLLASRGAPHDYAGHGERFQRTLASVRQSVNAEAKEPVCQVLADDRAKSAVSGATDVLPERAFYQLREMFRDQPDLLDAVDTLLSEERT